MKIISQTPDQMIIADPSASGWIYGAVIMILGLIVGYFALSQKQEVTTIVTIGFLIVGFVVIMLNKSRTTTINKTSGQIILQKKSIIGSTSFNYAIADVAQVEIRERVSFRNPSPRSSGMALPRPNIVHQTILVFKDGTSVALEHAHSGPRVGIDIMGIPVSTELGRDNVTSIAEVIAMFIGVPFQNSGPGMLQPMS